MEYILIGLVALVIGTGGSFALLKVFNKKAIREAEAEAELLKKNKWKIPANIEYEYKGADTIAEMKKCLAYCRQALGA